MNGNGHRPEPSPSHRKVNKSVGKHEFTAAFYPGFASSITVNGESLYNQKADGPYPFVLPSGSEKPMSTSAVDLSSTAGYRVVIHLDDPNHVVDRIEVVLRDPANGGVTAMSADSGASGSDTVTIVNTPVVCPPFC